MDQKIKLTHKEKAKAKQLKDLLDGNLSDKQVKDILYKNIIKNENDMYKRFNNIGLLHIYITRLEERITKLENIDEEHKKGHVKKVLEIYNKQLEKAKGDKNVKTNN